LGKQKDKKRRGIFRPVADNQHRPTTAKNALVWLEWAAEGMMPAKAARFLLLAAVSLVVSNVFGLVTRLQAPPLQPPSPPSLKRLVDPPLLKGGNDPRRAGFPAHAPFSFA
jgi:hypothetical protein